MYSIPKKTVGVAAVLLRMNRGSLPIMDRSCHLKCTRFTQIFWHNRRIKDNQHIRELIIFIYDFTPVGRWHREGTFNSCIADIFIANSLIMVIFVLLARIEDPPRYIMGIILFLFA